MYLRRTRKKAAPLRARMSKVTITPMAAEEVPLWVVPDSLAAWEAETEGIAVVGRIEGCWVVVLGVGVVVDEDEVVVVRGTKVVDGVVCGPFPMVAMARPGVVVAVSA